MAAPDKEALPCYYHYCSQLWFAYFELETYTVLTHHQIQMLLDRSALSCWMYPTAQIALSPTT
jgi:hypothetical protein